jgi:hypothetical protein
MQVQIRFYTVSALTLLVKIFHSSVNVTTRSRISKVKCMKRTNTEVPGSIPVHSLGFFWGSWVWNGVHSASWSDKLSSYLNKEVTIRFRKLKMQLWDSMCWPHVNTVPSGASGSCSAGQGSSEPVAPRIYYLLMVHGQKHWSRIFTQSLPA